MATIFKRKGSPIYYAAYDDRGGYQRALECIKMPMHEPVDVIRIKGGTGKGTGHREAKSKKPYLWSAVNKGGIPWIQFLGYEFRHDGHVRIRRKSLEKQCNKITEEVDKLIRTIKPQRKSRQADAEFSPGLRMNSRKILDRILRRLIAMSVGRIEVGNLPPLPPPQGPLATALRKQAGNHPQVGVRRVDGRKNIVTLREMPRGDVLKACFHPECMPVSRHVRDGGNTSIPPRRHRRE